MGRRFVPTSTITQRMDRQDARRARDLRARFPQLFAPDVVPFVEILLVPVDPNQPLAVVIDLQLVPKKAGDQ